ncbi:hypothetical protein CsSME_00024953 [Camellia sinensis var. sinensis]
MRQSLNEDDSWPFRKSNSMALCANVNGDSVWRLVPMARIEVANFINKKSPVWGIFILR